MNITRIRKELAECSKDPETSGITATPVGGSLKHLTGTLKGPVGTPYEGGVFVVDIHVPDTYVVEPPHTRGPRSAFRSARCAWNSSVLTLA